MEKKITVLLMLFAIFVNCSFVASIFAKEEAIKTVLLKATIKDKKTGKLIEDRLVVGIGLNAPGVVSHSFIAKNGKFEAPIITDRPIIYLEINKDEYQPYSRTIDVEATMEINVLLEPREKN
jgi:hypothetical protein